MPEEKPIKLFISYSHDSDEHAQKVLQFANALREYGYEVLIDQQVAAPQQGWSLWMNDGIANADYVLLICTETYKNRLTGKENKELGFGYRFESKLIYNHIYNQVSHNNKFLPVLFDIANKKHIPEWLSGYTFYLVRSQDPKTFDNLRRKLDNKQQIDLAAMPVSTGEIVGREKEIELLNQAWQDDDIRVISIIAWGGVGKSALINAWLNQMAENDFNGAERVFAHSFYSQGSSDQRQISAEHFINQAFNFLAYDGEKPSSPHEQGSLLAELFCQRKTLLILDGLEPMQYPPGELQGRLKDQSLIALLKHLAFNLKGLCVITSRVAVFELQSSNCPSYPLEQLSTAAGIQVLENNQVSGPKAEMEKAVAEVNGHALTLALLGSYIKTVYQGDIRKRDLMPAYSGKHPQGRHAKQVMASYHHWLNENNSPELDILHILGLFDRPATMAAINVLKTAPAIAGISEHVQNLNIEDWVFAIKNLKDLSLITTTEQNQTLDCHPLVREYFTEQLKSHNPAGYQTAHARLYEYYKNLPSKQLPDTLEELEPLFTAVAHGCLGGLHQQALDEVYWPRIKRKNEHYIISKLGAFGADLICIGYFFERPWAIPAEGLTAEVKAVVLNWAGFSLRGLGRLAEAVEPFEASVVMARQQKNWLEAAKNASNTSELYLSLGKLALAEQFGEKSVDYADNSGDDLQKMTKRITWADALLQSGQQQKAHQLFIAAEATQQQRQPEYPQLYGLWGFRFCVLLMDKAQDLSEVNQVIQRAEQTLSWAKLNGSLLGIALNQLTLGKAHFLTALIQHSTDFSPAQQYLNQAVAGLRAAGYQEFLSLGLIARAVLYRQQKKYQQAWADLDEVFESASYSQMPLHLTDYHLEACHNIRQQLNSGVTDFVIINRGQMLWSPNPLSPKQANQRRELMTNRFAHHLTAAESLINDIGYHRRDRALKELQNTKIKNISIQDKKIPEILSPEKSQKEIITLLFQAVVAKRHSPEILGSKSLLLQQVENVLTALAQSDAKKQGSLAEQLGWALPNALPNPLWLAWVDNHFGAELRRIIEQKR